MPLFRSKTPDIAGAVRQLAEIPLTLGVGIDAFDRQIAKAAARAPKKHRRVTPVPKPLPPLGIRHPHELPLRALRPLPMTVLEKRRQAERARGGTSATLGAKAQAAAAQVADRIRSGLRALQNGLGNATKRAGGRS